MVGSPVPPEEEGQEGPSLKELFALLEALEKEHAYLSWYEAKVAEVQWLLQRVFGYVMRGQRRWIPEIFQRIKETQRIVLPLAPRHPWAAGVLARLQMIEGAASVGLVLGNAGPAVVALRKESEALLELIRNIRDRRGKVGDEVKSVDAELSAKIRKMLVRQERAEFEHQLLLLKMKVAGWKREQWVAPTETAPPPGLNQATWNTMRDVDRKATQRWKQLQREITQRGGRPL